MGKEQTSGMLRGAFILTVAGVIGKILSAIYRIPLQNLTGDIGYYMYQQVYPIIGIGMILALYGFPQAVSKLTAERKARGLSINLREVYFPITVILFGLNVLCAFIVYYMAPTFASWGGDASLTDTYRATAGIFLIIPFLSGLRGFYQGHEQMKPTAVSQVVEQVMRVSIIIISAYFVFKGLLDVYAIGYMGVLASIVGMTLAMFVWIFFLRRKDKVSEGIRSTDIAWGYYVKTCFSLGILAAMSHLILLLMQVVDIFTIVPGLRNAGVDKTVAMESKGIFDRGQPLIQLGAVFGSSFALALVPSVVQGINEKTQPIREALQFGFYIAGAASLGLILLMPEVNRLLFKTADGTKSLRILMVAVILTALLIIVASILQNMGHVYTVACCIILAVAMKGLLNWLLIPHLYLVGSAIGTTLSLFFLFGILLLLLHRNVQGLSWLSGKNIAFFVYAASIMTGFIVLLQIMIPTDMLSRAGLFLFVMGSVAGGAFIYLSLLLKWKVFSNQQLQALPFGHKLIAASEWMNQKKRG